MKSQTTETIAQALEALDLSSAAAQLRTEHLLQQLFGDRTSLVDSFVRFWWMASKRK